MKKDTSNKNILFNKDNLVNWIIGGIVALIVGKIFEPLFAYLYSLFISLSGSLITIIANSTYKEISNGYSEQTSLLVLYMLCIFCMIGSTYIYWYERSNFLSFQSTINKLTTHLDSSANFDSTSEKDRKISQYTSEQKLSKLKKRIKQSVILNKISYFVTVVYIFFIVILFFFIYGRTTFIINKITTLTNNIEIVAPYISDQEYKELKSSFHLIESQEDYNDLANTLNTIASKYSLKLK